MSFKLIRRKLKRNYLLTKYEVILMGKKVAGALLLSAVILSTAPMLGIAEETESSIRTEAAVEAAQDWKEKTAEVAKGSVDQIKELWKKQFGSDERLERKKEEISYLKQKITALQETIQAKEQDLLAKSVTNQVKLAQAQSCVDTVAAFLSTNYEEGTDHEQ